MSHGMVAGLDKMVSGRKKSVWHQSETDVRFSDGLIDPDEAFDKAFGWEPTTVPAYAAQGDGEYLLIPGHSWVVRDDMSTDNPQRILGMVRSRFSLNGLGNRDNVEFAHALTSNGDARIDTAGSINGGKRIYVTAVLANEQQILDDTIAEWLLVTTAHDGTGSQEIMVCPLRVVCQNTLMWGMGASKHRFKIRHTPSAAKRMEEAAKAISKASDYFARHADAMRILAKRKMDRKNAEQLLLDTIIPGDSTRAKNNRTAVLDLFDGGQIGADMEAIKGTAYGLVSAWTQWAESSDGKSTRITKTGGRQAGESRMDAVLFGGTARDRDRLINASLELATA